MNSNYLNNENNLNINDDNILDNENKEDDYYDNFYN